jgi:hypothetical protein
MYPDIIKDWWRNKANFRADTHGVYAMASLNEYMVYVAMMLCRIFGKESPTHFPRNGYLFCMRPQKDTTSIGIRFYPIT